MLYMENIGKYQVFWGNWIAVFFRGFKLMEMQRVFQV